MLLSVVIPTRNRADRVGNLLDSFTRLDAAPFDWEVVVVDNGSTDGTADVVRQRQASSDGSDPVCR